MKQLGSILIAAGIILIVLGILFTMRSNIPLLGKLPGDIRISKPGFSLYFPITTSIILSVIISLVLYLLRIFR